MRRTQIIAVLQLVLIFPAALFMTALVVRNLGPLLYEPAHTARQLVMWYAGRMWTLWVLLLALPFTVLVSGCATLLHSRNHDIEPAHGTQKSLAVARPRWLTLFVSLTTVAAGGMLAIVVLHMLAN
jgi:hypothetical protein